MSCRQSTSRIARIETLERRDLLSLTTAGNLNVALEVSSTASDSDEATRSGSIGPLSIVAGAQAGAASISFHSNVTWGVETVLTSTEKKYVLSGHFDATSTASGPINPATGLEQYHISLQSFATVYWALTDANEQVSAITYEFATSGAFTNPFFPGGAIFNFSVPNHAGINGFIPGSPLGTGSLPVSRSGTIGWIFGDAASASFNWKVTVNVATPAHASVVSVNFDNTVPILPDPGTASPLFELDSSKKHYEDTDTDGEPDEQRPVLYVANSVPTLDAIFKVPQGGAGQFLVRGATSDGFHFQSTGSVSNGLLSVWGMQAKIDFGAAEAKSFGRQVKKYDQFSLAWEFSSDGGATWTSAGTSSNTLYVSAAVPAEIIESVPRELDPNYVTHTPGLGLFHTIVDVAITKNLGLTANQRNAIIDGTWRFFDMNEPTDAQLLDGSDLRYWGEGFNTAPAFTTSRLLFLRDGRCRAWSELFLNILAVNGVTPELGEGVLAVDSPNISFGEQLLIQEVRPWNTGRTEDPAYPFFLSGTVTNKSTGAVAPLSDIEILTGLPGQHNEDPPTFFGNHALVTIDGRIFDPSYGGRYESLLQWEDAALAGFLVWQDDTVVKSKNDPAVRLLLKDFAIGRLQTPGIPDVQFKIATTNFYKYATPPQSSLIAAEEAPLTATTHFALERKSDNWGTSFPQSPFLMATNDSFLEREMSQSPDSSDCQVFQIQKIAGRIWRELAHDRAFESLSLQEVELGIIPSTRNTHQFKELAKELDHSIAMSGLMDSLL